MCPERGVCAHEGQIDVAKRADLAVWDVRGIESAGSWDAAALVLAGPTRVRDLFVEGRQIVGEGTMLTVDTRALIARQNRLARALCG